MKITRTREHGTELFSVEFFCFSLFYTKPWMSHPHESSSNTMNIPKIYSMFCLLAWRHRNLEISLAHWGWMKPGDWNGTWNKKEKAFLVLETKKRKDRFVPRLLSCASWRRESCFVDVSCFAVIFIASSPFGSGFAEEENFLKFSRKKIKSFLIPSGVSFDWSGLLAGIRIKTSDIECPTNFSPIFLIPRFFKQTLPTRQWIF